MVGSWGVVSGCGLCCGHFHNLSVWVHSGCAFRFTPVCGNVVFAGFLMNSDCIMLWVFRPKWWDCPRMDGAGVVHGLLGGANPVNRILGFSVCCLFDVPVLGEEVVWV